MSVSLEQDYRLRWMDFDRHGRIKPSAILDMCQDVATVHANQLRMGRDDMLKQGVFWAVIRSKIEFFGDFKHFQVVTVRTWPHSPSRFSFLRDYTVRNEEGTLLAAMSSEWVLMDIETRKFTSVTDHYDVPDGLDEARVFAKKPRKVPAFTDENRPVVLLSPVYTDIDVNGHVNNAMYADFVLDALNPSEAVFLKTFQMDYRHEVLPAAPLEMHTYIESNRILFKGINEQGDIAFACAAELA